MFKPILKYGFLIIIFIIVFLLMFVFYENTIKVWKEKVNLKMEFKELNIDTEKYELNVYLWPEDGSFNSHNGWTLTPKYHYHFGVVNKTGKNSVGENYELWERNKGGGTIWLSRWLIGEWKNDTMSGPAIEIMYLPGDSEGECIQQIIFSSYPKDTLSNNCFHYYHLTNDRSLNYEIMNDSLIKSARQWAIKNIDF